MSINNNRFIITLKHIELPQDKHLSNFKQNELVKTTEFSTKTNNTMLLNYVEQNRSGDHIWWISDISKFKSHYPEWDLKYNVDQIISEIVTNLNK